MTDSEIIAVVQAHKEGKQIQYESRSGAWNDMIGEPYWQFYDHNYRVKPEPRKPREWMLAVVKTKCGDVAAHPEYIKASDVDDIETVRVREVIE